MAATTVAAGVGLGLLVPGLGATAATAAAGGTCSQVSSKHAVLCAARALNKNPDGTVSQDGGTSTAPAPTATAPAPAPTATAPAPAPTAAPAPAALLSETFSEPDGVFVDQAQFWSTADRGLSSNPRWFAESGVLSRQAGAGRTSSPVFRMWTRQSDLAHTRVETDVRFDGWAGGSEGWHGINLWLNARLCTPFPECSAVNDGGNSGYALDFMNRDGSLTILKKVPGDTRSTWSNGAIDYSYGGTYYWMTSTTWQPQQGRTYRLEGRTIDNGNGTTSVQLLVDGALKLQVLDDGRMGGPRLTGGRVGVRSDYANVAIDNLRITR